MGYKNNDLKKGAKFALFVSSYLPLFILVILRQLSDNYNYQKYNIETFSILHTLVGRIKNQPQNK